MHKATSIWFHFSDGFTFVAKLHTLKKSMFRVVRKPSQGASFVTALPLVLTDRQTDPVRTCSFECPFRSDAWWAPETNFDQISCFQSCLFFQTEKVNCFQVKNPPLDPHHWRWTSAFFSLCQSLWSTISPTRDFIEVFNMGMVVIGDGIIYSTNPESSRQQI